MMLDHLGARVASTQLMAAIEKVTSTGRVMPADLGGHATTRAVTDAVIDAIET
jgi:isocitrate/isopropylmalate dehydrogenase